MNGLKLWESVLEWLWNPAHEVWQEGFAQGFKRKVFRDSSRTSEGEGKQSFFSWGHREGGPALDTGCCVRCGFSCLTLLCPKPHRNSTNSATRWCRNTSTPSQTTPTSSEEKQEQKSTPTLPKQMTEELPSLIFCNILFVNIPPQTKTKKQKLCVYILTVLEVGTISFILAGDFICSKVLVQILLAPFFPMFYWGIK